MEFKDRLKQALKDNNMSQSTLAQKVGCSRGLISQYLKGTCKAKQDMIYSISNILNVSPSWLIGFELKENDDCLEIKERINNIINNLSVKELTRLEKIILLIYDES